MVEKWNSINDIDSPKNDTVFNNLVKAYSIINRVTYNKIMVSISGGADSDIVLDICYKCDRDNKCEYIWFDTGLEYDATKRHLRYLEEKYGIKIKRERKESYTNLLQRVWCSFRVKRCITEALWFTECRV